MTSSNLKDSNNKRRWGLDLSNTNTIKDKDGGSTSSLSTQNAPNVVGSGTGSNLQNNIRAQATPQQSKDLKIRKGWELAKSPAKSIFMTAFFLWMIGTGINIFTMPVVIYSVINPIKAIFQVNNMFSRFNDLKGDVIMMKLTFIAIQLILLGVTLYKCSSMGLLPITPSDWIYSLPIKTTKEISTGSII